MAGIVCLSIFCFILLIVMFLISNFCQHLSQNEMTYIKTFYLKQQMIMCKFAVFREENDAKNCAVQCQ